MDFSESCWEHIRIDALSETEDIVGCTTTQSDQGPQNLDVLYKQIDSIAKDIKKRLGEESFTTSVKKFVATYHKLSSKPSNAALISSLHRFGWCYGGAVTSLQSGIVRRGRRIPIQARSAGRGRVQQKGVKVQ